METDWLTKPENLWEGEGDLEDKVEEEWEMGEDGRGREKGATGRREQGEGGKKVERQGEGERENREGERECVRMCVNFE